jgi:Peptidase C13 family
MISAILSRVRAVGLCALLVLASGFASHAAEPSPKVTIVSFGLFGDQSVFESEAKGAARVLADRFHPASVIVRYNTKRGGDATTENLYSTLLDAAKGMDAQHDILMLVLTTHGSPRGLAVFAGKLREILPPPFLAATLDNTGIQHRVVIISACYSGIFIPPLANPDTLIITAADAEHPSFGCQDRVQWTYFGDAFFNTALRRTGNLTDAFAQARMLVRQRELKNGFEPSNPQIAGGANVEGLLQRAAVSGARSNPSPATAK